MVIPLSVVDAEQNYQTFLNVTPNTLIANLTTESVFSKISTLSKPAFLGYNVVNSSPKFDKGFLLGLGVSLFSSSPWARCGVGIGFTVILGSLSLIMTSRDWMEKSSQILKSQELAQKMLNTITELRLHIDEKTDTELKSTKNLNDLKNSALHNEYTTILQNKIEFVRDTYLMNGFTAESVNVILGPLERTLQDNLDRIKKKSNSILCHGHETPQVKEVLVKEAFGNA